MAHILWSVLLSKSEQIHLSPITLSVTEFFLFLVDSYMSPLEQVDINPLLHVFSPFCHLPFYFVYNFGHGI